MRTSFSSLSKLVPNTCFSNILYIFLYDIISKLFMNIGTMKISRELENTRCETQCEACRGSGKTKCVSCCKTLT